MTYSSNSNTLLDLQKTRSWRTNQLRVFLFFKSGQLHNKYDVYDMGGFTEFHLTSLFE